ncbi:MAG: hypothetical protein ACRYFZ_01625 [Janthinobacterium lividum]
MCFKDLPLYFENAAGHVREHPVGYAIVCYHAGERYELDLEVLLVHAGQLLRARGWNRLLSDQRLMTPYTLVEKTWVNAFWASQQGSHLGKFWLAVLATPLPT